MKVSVEKLKNSEVKLTIDLDEKDLKSYTVEAEKLLSGFLNVDGFRKGKIPKEIVRKEIKEEDIRKEALDIAMRKSFMEVIRKEKIDLLDTIDMKVKKNNAHSFQYEVLLLVFPEIKLGNYKDIEVESEKVNVTNQEIDNALEYIQKSRAQFKDIDTPIKKGDKIEINFEVKSTGKLIEGGKSDNHPLIVGENKFIPGFEDELINMKKGDKKNFSLKAPKDYYQKNIAGKKLDFNVEIKKVQHILLPDIDDEFAKSAGNFKDIDSLKQNITEGINTEKQAKEKERIRLAILDKIVGSSQLDVPSRLIENQLDLMVTNFDQSLHERGLELSLYLAQIKKTQDDLRKEWHEKAVKQVKTSLILREIGKEEEIKVEDKEVQLAVNELLQDFGSVEELQKNVNLKELDNKIRTNLFNDKIIIFLEKQAKIKKATP